MKNRMTRIKVKFSLILFLLCLAVTPIMAQDWVGTDRYKADNEKIGTALPNETRIVFMGNSITEGWSKICPGFFQGKPYINRGISGQTTTQMLARFRADVINLKPSIVIILAGTNDIAENNGPSTPEIILNNIISMAELAKYSGIKVILCSVLPALDYYWRPGLKPVEKIARLNIMIKKYAAETGCGYIDYYSSMADEQKGLKKELTSDGIHPNDTGYKIMAPLTEDAIKKALNIK